LQSSFHPSAQPNRLPAHNPAPSRRDVSGWPQLPTHRAQSACQVRNPWPTGSSAPVNVPWLPPSHSSQPTTNRSSSLRAVHIRRE
ncbi:MAG: hypothetical protein NZM04_00865, partial [Methylacidiphilales bacterium]|nr:hypothetical protein [Candidatus Methylacidiphilales bacterium]